MTEDLKNCRAEVPARPDTDGLTVGELASFSVEQEGAFSKCEGKVVALNSIIESGNAAIAGAYQKKPWWKVW